MMIDLRNLLNSTQVEEEIEILFNNECRVDKYGVPIEDNTKSQKIKCVITEKTNNSFNVNTGSYLRKNVYKLYIDKLRYGNIDYKGCVIKARNKILYVGSIDIDRRYVSHIVITATEDKVI